MFSFKQKMKCLLIIEWRSCWHFLDVICQNLIFISVFSWIDGSYKIEAHSKYFIMTRCLSIIDWTGWEQWIRVKSHDVQLFHPFHLMIIHIWWLNTPTGLCFIEDFSVGIVTKMAYCLKKLHHEWFELMSSVKCLLFMVQWFMNGKMETTWIVSPAEMKNLIQFW